MRQPSNLVEFTYNKHPAPDKLDLAPQQAV